jgi:hypothetical protein
MKMRRCWQAPTLLAVAMLLFGAGWAARAAADNNDGPGWRSISTLCRLLYVEGYKTGYYEAKADVYGVILGNFTQAMMKNEITEKQMKVLTALGQMPSHEDTWQEKLGWNGWVNTGETYGQIQEGMDKFYAIPANQAICWDTAIQVVYQSIAGQTFSSSDMSNIRRASLKTGCD